MKLVFRSVEGRCRDKPIFVGFFEFSHRTEFPSFGVCDIHQMGWRQRTVKEVVRVGCWAQAEVVHGGKRTQVARGVAGRANVKLYLQIVFKFISTAVG